MADPITRDTHLLRVDHVADFYRRYPGEDVTLFVRIVARQAVAGITLRVTLPAGLTVKGFQAHDEADDLVPVSDFGDRDTGLTWRIRRRVETGYTAEFQIQARVEELPRSEDVVLECRAAATPRVDGKDLLPDVESVSIQVAARGQYIRHLPALYYEDVFMGRLLMLFESFWKPIEQQIAHVPYYFDPKMTPARFLPWLASWLELAVDERLPEPRQRRLIQAVVSLYRRRGTRDGLREYLELYTGAPVHITEQRANNFRLGADGQLGAGVALGTGNRPHTFAVTVDLPPISAPGTRQRDRTRLERERRRRIEAIIEAEKPAHTDYVLRIETV
jgi:phage tail-like protein